MLRPLLRYDIALASPIGGGGGDVVILDVVLLLISLEFFFFGISKVFVKDRFTGVFFSCLFGALTGQSGR